MIKIKINLIIIIYLDNLHKIYIIIKIINKKIKFKELV
jgi:hypothetical protein